MADSKTYKRVLFNILFDIGSIVLGLILLGFIKYIDDFYKLEDFYIVFGAYILLLLILSVFTDKYEIRKKYRFNKILNRYLLAWGMASYLLIISVVIFDLRYYNWISLLITFCLIFVFEILLVSIKFSFRYARYVGEKMELKHSTLIKQAYESEIADAEEEDNGIVDSAGIRQGLIPLEAITNKDVLRLIQQYSDAVDFKPLYLNTIKRKILLPFKNKSYSLILNYSPINFLRYINKFFELANIKLKKEGYLIICVETLEQRKERYRKKYPVILFQAHSLFEFFVHRVWPRLPFFKKSYYWIWKNISKRISFAETLGRLYSCGFEHVEDIKSMGYTWIVVRKIKNPLLTFDVTYSPIIKLKRIGKGGKIISVYKMRTMHPYSEFLQEYVYKINQLADGGKFKDDFRVTAMGKFMRKFWIDELPMVANLLKRELKIVGVRPLSKHYFGLYPPEVQKQRIKSKPGLIPPFYVDMPKTFKEIVDSEKRYLEMHEKSHFATDWKYFGKAVVNILFKRARSK
jgi:lipopolysaccharide/colanic/teichoic acid biosynthesis glycosyltransferase